MLLYGEVQPHCRVFSEEAFVHVLDLKHTQIRRKRIIASYLPTMSRVQPIVCRGCFAIIQTQVMMAEKVSWITLSKKPDLGRAFQAKTRPWLCFTNQNHTA